MKNVKRLKFLGTFIHWNTGAKERHLVSAKDSWTQWDTINMVHHVENTEAFANGDKKWIHKKELQPANVVAAAFVQIESDAVHVLI